MRDGRLAHGEVLIDELIARMPDDLTRSGALLDRARRAVRIPGAGEALARPAIQGVLEMNASGEHTAAAKTLLFDLDNLNIGSQATLFTRFDLEGAWCISPGRKSAWC